METYTDFGASYLIQTFVNKINTKLLNIVELFPSSPPPLSPYLPNFTFSERTFGILWNERQFVVRIEAVVFTNLTKVTWRNCYRQ